MESGAEHERMEQLRTSDPGWRRWGPYLSERQWGTVREDYSADGNAWDYLPHDHARSRAYRWGEDGIAGISDERQHLCLSLALWNGCDPILKERFFGLTNNEGNHGEDVKELYYYLDATPTHSYLKMLYKYPQRAFPYDALVAENRRRGKQDAEYELLDTGVFDEDRYFDVLIEYAKADVDDILMLVTVQNRGPDAAEIHVLPQLWFRNEWSWKPSAERPALRASGSGVAAEHARLGSYRFDAEGAPRLLFCENDTNAARHFGDAAAGYYKDAFHECVAGGREDAVNPANIGTKAAAHYRVDIPAGARAEFRIRLRRQHADDAKRGGVNASGAFADFDAVMSTRRAEADAYYAFVQQEISDADARRVQRQAYAGMIWSKQFYCFDIPEWLRGDPAQPPPPAERRQGRNRDWMHLNNADIISMPDKWEYPWYAAWDLAFHCIPLANIDPEFAKSQLLLLTREWYMHPSGQLPAYEWAFGDVNPPVHAWATWRVFQVDRKLRRATELDHVGDIAFLERVFHKLLLNFTWWVNRKDAQGRNVFQGGFLGLDNIGVFDRSAPLPTGGFINQADGTSWMAMYSLNLLRIALELALYNPVYEDIATKFFEHFLHIAEAMNNIGADAPVGAGAEHGVGLWDPHDEFFYDVLNTPDGRAAPLKVRSMVGLIPLFAVETLEPELLAKLPEFTRRMEWFLKYRPDLAALVGEWHVPGRGDRRLLSLLRPERLRAVLRRMLDENEFLSDYGVRALSRYHRDNPYVFHCNGDALTVRYQSAESDSGAFGGNSNWRGPIWMPVNYLIVESLQKFHHFHGDDLQVELPTGSGAMRNLLDVAGDLGRRLTSIFMRDGDGRRPIFGGDNRLQNDPHFREHVLFYEYMDGDNGRGVGASHQTGWTGLVAKLLQPRSRDSIAHAAAAAPTSTTRRTKRAQPVQVPAPK